MSAAVDRPFRLGDAMVMIAALAVGFGIVREGASKASTPGSSGYILVISAPEWLIGPPSLGNFLPERYIWVPLGGWDADDWPTRIMGAWTLIGPCLLSATIAALVLRLWPSPAARALWTQPGWAGCLAAAAIIGLTLLPGAGYAAKSGSKHWVLHLFEYGAVFGPIGAGAGVMIAWIILLSLRRWRAEASWIDRLGRLLSACHVIAGASMVYYLRTRL